MVYPDRTPFDDTGVPGRHQDDQLSERCLFMAYRGRRRLGGCRRIHLTRSDVPALGWVGAVC